MAAMDGTFFLVGCSDDSAWKGVALITETKTTASDIVCVKYMGGSFDPFDIATQIAQYAHRPRVRFGTNFYVPIHLFLGGLPASALSLRATQILSNRTRRPSRIDSQTIPRLPLVRSMSGYQSPNPTPVASTRFSSSNERPGSAGPKGAPPRLRRIPANGEPGCL